MPASAGMTGLDDAPLPLESSHQETTMNEKIETGFMAFLAEGKEGIGAVRAVAGDHIIVYVENGGEFEVARSAVRRVHDAKVILDAAKLDKALLAALGHSHDREDPNLVG